MMRKTFPLRMVLFGFAATMLAATVLWGTQAAASPPARASYAKNADVQRMAGSLKPPQAKRKSKARQRAEKRARSKKAVSARNESNFGNLNR